MLEHADYSPEDCRALNEILARVGDRWTILVIGHLSKGPMRFNDLRRAADGITQRMLTLTLRALERDGLVTRTQYPTVPPAVDYALTDRGLSLLGPLFSLGEWARAHRLPIEASRANFDRASADAAAAAPPPGIHLIATKVR